MCGIIGYVGPSEAYPILLEGLGRLEYRGYDSAGLATIVDSGKLEIRRAKGKLENLRNLLADSPLQGHIGIGHTRWATHGRPSEENAHPHKAGPVAVIHNGIVENFVDLRAELLARGHKLSSETDTELISHLIEEKLKGGRGLTEAVREAVLRIRGSFSNRRAVGNRTRQAGRRQDCDANGARSGRRREFHRIGYSRDSRAHAQRDGSSRTASLPRSPPAQFG